LKDLPHNPDISAHRAFVYSAGGPGAGEIYAGARIRGAITVALIIVLAIWFMLNLYSVLQTVVGRVFDSLNSLDPLVLPDMPLVALGVSFLGLYFLWLWAMIAAVDAAVSHRQRYKAQLQASVAWAITMSWFCPGSGQVYSAERRLGYILFAAYLIGFLLTFPAYRQLFQDLSGMANSGKLSPHDPYAVAGMVHELVARVDYGFGKLFQTAVKYFALAATLAGLRHGPLAADTRWSRPSILYGAALVGMGWLCPGSGQLLQQRDKIGWLLLSGYLGGKFIIGLLLGTDMVTVQTADTLAWLPLLIQWASMFEAPIRTVIDNDRKKAEREI